MGKGHQVREGALKVTTINAHDPGNLYPSAILDWEGAGWYAAACTGGQCSIRRLSSEDTYPPHTWGTGYGTATWCETPTEALGNYAAFVIA